MNFPPLKTYPISLILLIHCYCRYTKIEIYEFANNKMIHRRRRLHKNLIDGDLREKGIGE